MSQEIVKLAVSTNLADALFGIRLELESLAPEAQGRDKEELNDAFSKIMDIAHARDEILLEEPFVPSRLSGLVRELTDIRGTLSKMRDRRTSQGLSDLCSSG